MATLHDEVQAVLDGIGNPELHAAVEDALARMKPPHNEEPWVAIQRAADAAGLTPQAVGAVTGKIAAVVKKHKREAKLRAAKHNPLVGCCKNPQTYGGCYD